MWFVFYLFLFALGYLSYRYSVPVKQVYREPEPLVRDKKSISRTSSLAPSSSSSSSSSSSAAVLSPSPDSSVSSPSSASSSSSSSSSPLPPPSASLSPSSCLGQLLSRRSSILTEILTSEQSYVQSLTTLIALYVAPLRAKVQKGSHKLTDQDFTHLFSNVEQIVSIHTALLSHLEEAMNHASFDNVTVAAVIGVYSRYVDYFKMYTAYVGSYDECISTLARLDKNSEWKKFLKSKREEKEAKMRDITSFLIMPIQRIPRYELLFRELSRSSEADPLDDEQVTKLNTLLSKINAVAKHVNEQKRTMENSSLILEIQNRVSGLPEPLLTPARFLVRSEELPCIIYSQSSSSSSSSSSRGSGSSGAVLTRVMLFTDVLVLTDRQHHFIAWYRLDDNTVNASGSGSGSGNDGSENQSENVSSIVVEQVQGPDDKTGLRITRKGGEKLVDLFPDLSLSLAQWKNDFEKTNKELSNPHHLRSHSTNQLQLSTSTA